MRGRNALVSCKVSHWYTSRVEMEDTLETTSPVARTASARTPFPDWAWWALTALLSGVAAYGAVDGLGAARTLALVVGVAVAGVTLYRPVFGPLVIMAAMPLDVAGRLIVSPVTVTLFHLALLLTLGAWAVHLLFGRARKVRFSAVDGAMALLVIAALWSYPNSLSPGETLFGAVRLAFLALLVLAFENLVTTRLWLRRVLDVLLGTGFLMSLLTIAQFIAPDLAPAASGDTISVGGRQVARVSGLFDDPNILAGFLSIVVVVALFRLVHSSLMRQMAMYAAVFVCSSGALLLTFSRTGWLGAAAGCLIVFFFAPRARKLLMVAVVCVSVIVALTVAGDAIAARADAIVNPTDNSAQTRVLMFESTIEMIGDYWVWGTGLNGYDEAYPEYRIPGANLTVLKPHQVPLALFAQMGVLGALVAIVLVLALGAQFVPVPATGWSEEQKLVLAALAALMLESWFQYYLYFEYLWVFAALAVVASRLAREGESSA